MQENNTKHPAAPVKPVNEITDKTAIIWTHDTRLAAALVAVGVKLRLDPPYTYRIEDGRPVVTWNFEPFTSDGMFQTIDLIRAYKKDVEWTNDNPQHPFTYALDAIKNIIAMTEHINHDVPFVGFRSRNGRATIFVKQNSAKHRKCVALNMQQI